MADGICKNACYFMLAKRNLILLALTLNIGLVMSCPYMLSAKLLLWPVWMSNGWSSPLDLSPSLSAFKNALTAALLWMYRRYIALLLCFHPMMFNLMLMCCNDFFCMVYLTWLVFYISTPHCGLAAGFLSTFLSYPSGLAAWLLLRT
jgi:hypothetical protein